MTVTTAKAWYANAASNSFVNQLSKIYDFFNRTSVLDYHTILFYDLSASPSNFSFPYILIRNETAGYRVFLYADSSNGIFALLDPTDAITNPVSPTTSTPANYASAPAAASSSGFMNVHQTTVGSYGTLIHAAEYPDAFFFAIKHSTSEYWLSGLHAGKIYVPFNASDAAIGIDGYGIMCSSPTVGTSNTTGWCSYSSTSQSRFRTGTSTWSRCVNNDYKNSDSNPTEASDLNGNVRLNPYLLRESDTSGNYKSYIGYTKYIRSYKTSGGHGAVIQASDASDQAWFRFGFSTSLTSGVILWSKTAVSG